MPKAGRPPGTFKSVSKRSYRVQTYITKETYHWIKKQPRGYIADKLEEIAKNEEN
jgi:hypothetical protein